MRVGIFDSGIGGLTVLHNLIKNYPNNEYIYYGDTLNLPYGNKTKEELEQLSSKDIEFLLSKKVDIIIIACGTVSSNCLDYLQNKYSIPIYDIISPTIKYLNNSDYNNIGVIATTRTIKSHIFKNNLNKHKTLYEIETPDLVPLIESNNLDNINNVLNKYLSEYKDKIDILILGCTHYPTISNHINKYLNNKVELLDMSNLLLNKLSNDTKSSITIYFSKLSETLINNTKRILELDNINIYEDL